MAKVVREVLQWQTVAANSATAYFQPGGPWREAAGITGARSNAEMRGRNGNAQAQAAVQTANDIRNPDTPAIGVGAAMTADGVSDPNGETSIASGTKRYIRSGWLVSLTSGSTLATAAVGGEIEYLYG